VRSARKSKLLQVMGPRCDVNLWKPLTLEEQENKLARTVEFINAEIKTLKEKIGTLYIARKSTIYFLKGIQMKMKGIPKEPRCFKCQNIGHTAARCTADLNLENEKKRREKVINKLNDQIKFNSSEELKKKKDQLIKEWRSTDKRIKGKLYENRLKPENLVKEQIANSNAKIEKSRSLNEGGVIIKKQVSIQEDLKKSSNSQSCQEKTKSPDVENLGLYRIDAQIKSNQKSQSNLQECPKNVGNSSSSLPKIISQNADNSYQVEQINKTIKNIPSSELIGTSLEKQFQQKLKQQLPTHTNLKLLKARFDGEFSNTTLFIKFHRDLTAWIKISTIQELNPIAWKTIEIKVKSKWNFAEKSKFLD